MSLKVQTLKLVFLSVRHNTGQQWKDWNGYRIFTLSCHHTEIFCHALGAVSIEIHLWYSAASRLNRDICIAMCIVLRSSWQYPALAEEIVICKSATAAVAILNQVDPPFSIPWSLALEMRCCPSPSCGTLVLSAHPWHFIAQTRMHIRI